MNHFKYLFWFVHYIVFKLKPGHYRTYFHHNIVAVNVRAFRHKPEASNCAAV